MNESSGLVGEGEIADEDIREWWESGDSVTLITRPGRFGKTLNMSMLEKFFSVNYEDRGDLFQGLRIWEEKFPENFSGGENFSLEDYNYRKLQGTYLVLFLSFADVKETSYDIDFPARSSRSETGMMAFLLGREGIFIIPGLSSIFWEKESRHLLGQYQL